MTGIVHLRGSSLGDPACIQTLPVLPFKYRNNTTHMDAVLSMPLGSPGGDKSVHYPNSGINSLMN